MIPPLPRHFHPHHRPPISSGGPREGAGNGRETLVHVWDKEANVASLEQDTQLYIKGVHYEAKIEESVWGEDVT